MNQIPASKCGPKLRKELLDTVDRVIRRLALTGKTGLYGRLLYVAEPEPILPEEWEAAGLGPAEEATAFVRLLGDGIPELRINPHFFLPLTEAGQLFVLAHEALHLIYAHLHRNVEYRSDPMWMYAKEAIVNLHALEIFGLSEIPVPGNPVDPKKLYQSYRQTAKRQGVEPTAQDDFYRSDLDCYHYLRAVSPKIRSMQTCALWGDDHSGGEDGQSTPAGIGEQADPDELAHIVNSALQDAVNRARAGDEEQKQALLALADLSSESTTWGDLGLDALRGRTETGRAHSVWEKLLGRTLQSKVTRRGERLAYNRKTGFFPTGDPRIGRPLGAVGRGTQAQVVIAIDTSGSMGQGTIEKIAQRVGKLPNTDATWLAFDADVYPFSPGEELRGGGGTSFKVVSDYIFNSGELDFEPDAILVVTDGYAEELTPPLRDRWIWAVTKGGSTWMRSRGMSVIEGVGEIDG